MAVPPLNTDTTFVIRGAIYVFASGAFFTLAGIAVKYAAQTMPVESIVFFRNIFAMLAFGPWLMATRMNGLISQVPCLHVIRMISGLSAMYCYYYALTVMPLADAILLNFTGPVFTPLVAYLWYKKHINRSTLIALCIGFLGVAIIIQPQNIIFNPTMLIGLLAGMFGAVSVVAIWKMGSTEPAGRIVFYYTVGSTFVSAIPMALYGKIPSDNITWLTLIACGVLSAIAHFLLAKGCSIAPADRTNALSYGSVLFAALSGWAIWGEQIGMGFVIGTIFITISATLVTRHKA